MDIQTSKNVHRFSLIGVSGDIVRSGGGMPIQTNIGTQKTYLKSTKYQTTRNLDAFCHLPKQPNINASQTHIFEIKKNILRFELQLDLRENTNAICELQTCLLEEQYYLI